jgi:hypothetical protein
VGPPRIGYRLGVNPATMGKVLARYQVPRLAWTDPATGSRLRAKPKAFRYEHAAPGDLVHVDIKKLGRIPDGGGRRFLGRAARIRVKKSARPGTAYLHHPVDDHTRLVYSANLADERKERPPVRSGPAPTTTGPAPGSTSAKRNAKRRTATLIHTYIHHRGHTALGAKSPADRVPNLRGQYT